jgi:NADPH:quinone reductase-like Zn-dependent oxidoreductase
MSRRVQYSRLGGPEVLDVVEVEPPHAGEGEVRVRVQAAGLNPIDHKIFRGAPTSAAREVSFPAGNGGDFAGIVDELGAGVTNFSIGDLVFGGKFGHAQADYVVADAAALAHVPAGLTIEQAGSLDIVARTAAASVAAIAPTSSDTVFVSAAAGGVGVVASQLLVRVGATVIGSCGPDNVEFVRSLGVYPVVYGDRLVDELRALAPNGITAALDNHGRASVDAAIALGAKPARINTIADYQAVADYGVTSVGGSAAGVPELEEVAALIAAGELVFPIDSIYPVERVRDAYEHLIAGHVRGKVVLTFGE